MKITNYNEQYGLDLGGGTSVTSYAVAHTSLGSNLPIVESGAGAAGSGPQAAAWDHVHPAYGSSSSFGSNSTRVSSAPAAGASSSNSRADHVHDGIGTLTASSSNTLARGTVNLRPGTNIAFDLNAGLDTLTINSLASGGSGGSVSYGSNSNRVAAASATGASTLVSRTDHVHDGIGTVTASSSNTLNRGSFNLRAGTGIALALSNTDGGSGFDSVTIQNIAAASSGGGGGSASTNAPDGKPWNFTPPSSANSKDDEFADATSQSGPVNGLDAKWSKHNLGTSTWLRLDDTYAPGCLGFNIPNGQASDQIVYQSVPAGDFTIQCRFTWEYIAGRQMWGPVILNSSGDGIGIRFDNGDTTPRLMYMATWNQAATVADFTPTYTGVQLGTPITCWLRKSGNDFYGAATLGDRALRPLLTEATLNRTFTAAYCGFGRSYVSGTSNAVVTLDYFRIT